jgi:hypothetical protein
MLNAREFSVDCVGASRVALDDPPNCVSLSYFPLSGSLSVLFENVCAKFEVFKKDVPLSFQYRELVHYALFLAFSFSLGTLSTPHFRYLFTFT